VAAAHSVYVMAVLLMAIVSSGRWSGSQHARPYSAHEVPMVCAV
jgi:hypothetical protein